MNDEELCSMFGTSLEEVERDVQRVYEGGDFTGVVFGEPIDGLPPARLKTSSVKFYDSELKAIDMTASTYVFDVSKRKPKPEPASSTKKINPPNQWLTHVNSHPPSKLTSHPHTSNPRALHVRNLANDTQRSITLFLVAHRFAERHRNLNHGRGNSHTTIVFTERTTCAQSAHTITNCQR